MKFKVINSFEKDCLHNDYIKILKPFICYKTDKEVFIEIHYLEELLLIAKITESSLIFNALDKEIEIYDSWRE